jgi:hypothetical protein
MVCFLGNGRDCPATVDGRKESFEVELAALLGRCHGYHDRPLPMLKDAKNPRRARSQLCDSRFGTVNPKYFQVLRKRNKLMSGERQHGVLARRWANSL